MSACAGNADVRLEPIGMTLQIVLIQEI